MNSAGGSRLFVHRRPKYHRRSWPNPFAGPAVAAAQRCRRGFRRADPRSLLERILDTPQLAEVVPRLPPEVLQRLVRHCGLEDCGELVALTTADQFARVLDLDLWPAEPGLDEQFDAARFGVWLEVLMECGATIAARKMAEIEPDLMVAALSQHALVFDAAAVSRSAGDDDDGDAIASRSLRDGLGCEVGGYLVLARGTDSWDAIAAALALLEDEHPTYFHRVMRGCRGLSNSAPELDGLDALASAREQAAYDLAVARIAGASGRDSSRPRTRVHFSSCRGSCGSVVTPRRLPIRSRPATSARWSGRRRPMRRPTAMPPLPRRWSSTLSSTPVSSCSRCARYCSKAGAARCRGWSA